MPADSPTPIHPALRIVRSRFVQMLVVVLTVGIAMIYWVDSIGGVLEFRNRFGNSAPLVTIPFHAVVSLTPFPSFVLSMANGTLYGFAVGAVVSWIGWYIAAFLQFGLGRRARRDFNLETSVSHLPTFLTRIPVGHPAFMMGSRMVPWLGGHVANFVPGAAGVSWSRHAWCAAISIIPGAVIAAAIGAGLW